MYVAVDRVTPSTQETTDLEAEAQELDMIQHSNSPMVFEALSLQYIPCRLYALAYVQTPSAAECTRHIDAHTPNSTGTCQALSLIIPTFCSTAAPSSEA